MKKYLRLFKMGKLERKAFAHNYKFSYLSIGIQIAISFYFWRFANIDQLATDFTLSSIMMYFLALSILTLVFTPAMYICYETWTSINSGEIIIWISRPVNYILMKFFEKLGIFITTSALPMAAYILIYTIFYKGEIRHIFFGILSALAGYVILFLVQMLIGLLSFWVKKTITMRDLIFEIFAILGGSLMPIDFFPTFIQKLSLYSPFAYIYYLPSKILSGAMDQNYGKGLVIQIIWIIILYITCQALYKFGKNKTVQGG